MMKLAGWLLWSRKLASEAYYSGEAPVCRWVQLVGGVTLPNPRSLVGAEQRL
jgi:hypothetical protein